MRSLAGKPASRDTASGTDPSRTADSHEAEAERAVGQLCRLSGSDFVAAPPPPGPRDAPGPSAEPLDPGLRDRMEAHLGHDFGSIRIHADERAQEEALRRGARAFARGRDLVFGPGQYAPATPAGRGLIAHELVHAAQQGAARPIAGAARMPLSRTAGPVVQHRDWGEGELPPMTPEDFRAAVIIAAVDVVAEDAPTLGPPMQRILEGDPEIESVENVLDRAERRSAGLTHAQQMDFVDETADLVIRTFILDPDTSSLDLLTERQRRRYRNFAWDEADYLGGTEGPNEDRNRQMLRQLGGVRPERRANSTDDAVVDQGRFSDAVDRHIAGNLVEIPQFPEPEEEGATRPFQRTGKELYRTAHESFLRMRTAALADGVVLRVRSAYREPEESQRRAAAADNANAVAEFSSHNLGLAVDLHMGHRWEDPEGGRHRQSFAETSTRDMQNVIDIRESPAHKWMFLHGAEYGWFPFQQEPWHWEYNPEGFPDAFAANVAAEEEAAAAAAAEAAARARENHEPEEQPEE